MNSQPEAQQRQHPRVAAERPLDVPLVTLYDASVRPPLRDDSSRLRFAVDAFVHMSRYFSTSCNADASTILSAFHCVAEPTISLADYIERLDNRTRVGEEAVLIGFIIVARYCVAMQMLPSVLSMHRLLLVGTRIATKAHHDFFRSNRAVARSGGLTLQELNQLEIVMLVKLDYRVTVTLEELIALRNALQCIYTLSPCTVPQRKTAVARILARALNLQPLETSRATPVALLTNPDCNSPPPLSPTLTSPAGSASLLRRVSTASGAGTGAARLLGEWRRESVQSVATTERTGSTDWNDSVACLDDLQGSSSAGPDVLHSMVLAAAGSWT